jgi:UDP-glucose 4-epimerase
MAILVTGGAGYIGSHATQALLDAGREVVVLDSLITGSRDQVPRGARFELGDVHEEAKLESIMRQSHIDAVLHFAALISVEESTREPEKYFHNNEKGTEALMHAAARAGVLRVIFSSTAAVYGNPAVVPVREDAALAPINPYGDSKARAEAHVRQFPGKYIILRYFNVVGADPQGRCGYKLERNPSHLVRSALQVMRGQKDELKIFGTDYPTPDGTAVRDYVHVTDLVDAHLLALQYLEKGGESLTLNCGYGHGFSVFDVVRAVERVVRKKLPVEYVDRRAGDPAQLISNPSRIHQTLQWQPKFDDLDTMVRHQWDWERSQAK